MSMADVARSGGGRSGLVGKCVMRRAEVRLSGTVSAHFRYAFKTSFPLREVAHETVVIEKVGSGLRDLIDHFCQQAGFTPRIVYEVDEPAVLFEFVKAHLGVAFTPTLVKKQINEQTLTALHLTNPSCQRTFGIAWHQEHYLSEAARAFRQFVIEYFANLSKKHPL